MYDIIISLTVPLSKLQINGRIHFTNIFFTVKDCVQLDTWTTEYGGQNEHL